MFGLVELVLILVFLLGGAFWIWMLVDCATKEPDFGNSKLVWILINHLYRMHRGRRLLLCPSVQEKSGADQLIR